MFSKVESFICEILLYVLGSTFVFLIGILTLLLCFFCFFVKSVYFADFLLRRIELEFQKV